MKAAINVLGSVDAEEVLLQRLKAGDEAAYETLVHELGPRMLATAHRLLGNEQDARDAVQESYLSAFKALASFHGRSRLSTWLHRIVVNVALMKLRTRRRHAELSIEPFLPAFTEDGHRLDPRPAWTTTSEALLEREETCRTVRGCIDRLPVDYRTIVMLRDIEELDTEETARVLGISTGSVKTRLHRARQALRTLIENQLGSLLYS